jgi:hypothetical protein
VGARTGTGGIAMSRTGTATRTIEVVVVDTDKAGFGFDDFCTHAGIGYDRNDFNRWVYVYVPDYYQGKRLLTGHWWDWWGKFCVQQDARDQADTQADALRW